MRCLLAIANIWILGPISWSDGPRPSVRAWSISPRAGAHACVFLVNMLISDSDLLAERADARCV